MEPKCAVAIGVSVAAAKLQGVEKYADYQFEQLLSEETNEEVPVHKETENEEDHLMTDQDNNTDEFDCNTETCI